MGSKKVYYPGHERSHLRDPETRLTVPQACESGLLCFEDGPMLFSWLFLSQLHFQPAMVRVT